MIEIKGLNSLEKKLNKMADNLVKNTMEAMTKVMEDGQKTALQNKRGSKDEAMIPYEVKSENKGVVGKLHTDKSKFSHALFLEYGTGTEAEMAHIGTTKTFIKSGYQWWLLPIEKAPRDFGTPIMINGKEFFVMHPQSPQPFMRPTAFYLRDNAKLVLAKELKERIKKDL